MSRHYPALEELSERLLANGCIKSGHRHIATAILGLAHANQWMKQPKRMAAWLEQLALELGRLGADK